MLSYEGIFLNEDMLKIIHSLEKDRLSLINDEIHCTFKYHPSEEEIFNEIVGSEFVVYLIGYANDGQNSGFEIELPAELKKYYINYDDEGKLKKPHITASLSENAKAYNTCKLNFIPLEKKIPITCKFGFWIKEADGNEYLTFEPYIQKKK